MNNVRDWWSALTSFSFCLFCIIVLSKGLEAKEHAHEELQETIHELECIKVAALETKADLHLQLESRSDTDWMELLLKKRLGVVPEGQIKVYFQRDE